jgi:hypothetical protein
MILGEGENRESVSYQDALQFHRDLFTQHDESRLNQTYETVLAEVDRLYGARGVSAFKAALVDPSDPDSRLKDQKSLRLAMGAVDRQMSAIMSEIQKIPQTPEATVRAELKKTWDVAGNYDYDRKPGLLPEYAKIFPSQVLVDLERSTVSIDQSGNLFIRAGTAFTSAKALNNRCETLVAFFEKGSGVSRDKPEFENMFKNFIRNFHQGGIATMSNEVGRHQLSLGLQLNEFNFNGGGSKYAVSIKFNAGAIEWDVSHDAAGQFLTEHNPFSFSVRERFAIPVDALRKSESTLDISSEVTLSERSISIVPKPFEKPSELSASAKTEVAAAWESVGASGVIESDRINNLNFRFPVQTLFHSDILGRGQALVDQGNLVLRHAIGSNTTIATNVTAWEQFIADIFREGSDDDMKVASENLSGFITQASTADITIDFQELAREVYEAAPKDGMEFRGVSQADFAYSLSLSEDNRSIVIKQTGRFEGFKIQNIDENHPQYMEAEVIKRPYAYTREISIPLGELITKPFDTDRIKILSVERGFLAEK